MQIEDFKSWHWVAIGILVGALYSGTLFIAGPWFDGESLDTIDLTSFEHGAIGQLTHHDDPNPWLLDQFHAGKPVMTEVVIHPPLRGDPGHNWVTGKLYSIKPQLSDPSNATSKRQVVEQWRPFKYLATIPFVADYGVPELEAARAQAAATAAAARKTATSKRAAFPLATPTVTFPSVSAYLMSASKTPGGATLRYRYAWQEAPAALWTLPPLAGLLMIGIAWPLSLRAMQSFGMARPPVVKKKPKPAPEPMPVIKAVTGVRMAPPPPPPPPPKPARDPDDKEYGGEFYPVVKATHHE